MGNRLRSKKFADDFNNPGSTNIDLPFRNSLLSLYRFEPKVWKKSTNMALLKVYHINSKRYLVKKKLTHSPSHHKAICQELSVLLYLDHMSIIKVYHYFQTATHYYINYHYFDAPTIVDYCAKLETELSMSTIKYILKATLEVLQYLHNNHIVLRNFDARNLLFDGKELIFIDFSKAMFLRPNEMGVKKYKFAKNYASPLYQAPEVINKSYDHKSELWGAGVLMHLLLVGEMPFYDTTKDRIKKKILEAPLNEKLFQQRKLNPLAVDLIKRLLEKDPAKRLSANEALKSPWFDLKEETVDSKDVRDIFRKVKLVSHKLSFTDDLMSFMVGKSFKNEEYKKFEVLFRKFDENKDGMITKDEMKRIAETLNLIISDNDVEKIFAKYDVNKTGTLEFNEFLTALMDRDNLNDKEKLAEYFDFVDDRQTNRIDFDDMSKLIGPRCNPVMLKKVFNNHSGRDRVLNKAKFVSFIEELITSIYSREVKRTKTKGQADIYEG